MLHGRLLTDLVDYGADRLCLPASGKLEVNNGALIPFIRTTGGAGGTTTRVSNLADFASAVAGDAKKTVIVTGMPVRLD